MNLLSNANLARALGVPHSRVSEWIKRGMPRDIEAAKVWRMAHAPPRRQPQVPEGAPPLPSSAHPDDSWSTRIARAKAAEAHLYTTIKSKINSADPSELNKLRFSHLRALERLAEIEREALETQLRRGEVIPIEDVRAIWAALLPPLRTHLNRGAPQNIPSLVNEAPRPAASSPGPWSRALLARLDAIQVSFKGP